MAKKMTNPVGSWAFIIALILALVLGALERISPQIAYILVILGIIVGLLNVTQKETKDFLLGGVVLVIVSALGISEMSLISTVKSVFDGLLLVFVPATAVVALKEMLGLARN